MWAGQVLGLKGVGQKPGHGPLLPSMWERKKLLLRQVQWYVRNIKAGQIQGKKFYKVGKHKTFLRYNALKLSNSVWAG